MADCGMKRLPSPLPSSLTLVLFFSLQKKSKDHFGLEGDEESTMLEDSVSPKKYEGNWADPIPWAGKARQNPQGLWEVGSP